MRRSHPLAIFCAGLALLAASGAQSAVTFSVASSVASGNALDELVIGDLVTFDITLRSDGEASYGIGASAFQWDPGRIQYVSGAAAPSILNSICVSGDCFGGLPIGILGPQQFRDPGVVSFAQHLSLTPATGTGALDPGVVTGIAGDPQFRLVFEATSAGSTLFEFGSSLNNGDVLVLAGGAIGEVESAFASITIGGGSGDTSGGGTPPIHIGDGYAGGGSRSAPPIPEPGAALLMAVGLTCVSVSARWHRRS